jgi:thiol:disulfide interchange protein
MRTLRSIFVICILVAAGLSARAASSSADAPHVRVELRHSEMLYLGGDAKLNIAGIYFKLEPGWHIYWSNAGDSGEPPKIQWTLPEGFTASPLEFPAPKRLPLGPLMDYGYEGDVLLPFHFGVGDQVNPKHSGGELGPFPLKAHVTWLVCREVCIPGKADLEVDTKVWAGLYEILTPRNQTLGQKFFGELRPDLPELPQALPSGDSVLFQMSPTGFRLAITTGRRETEGVFFPEDNILDNPAPQTVTPTAKGLILDLKKDANLTSNPAQLKGVLELSGGRNYEIAALPGTVAAPATLAFSLAALARISGLAFLGGLLLNLMPCVFPVLFLKGLALVNSGSEERRTLRNHGFVYAFGILVSFWVLVAALLGLRAAGATLGWGFQFQSPLFLMLMAGLLFFIGLSLAGQFEIGFSVTRAGGSLAAKQGYAGSFFTGVLAVVVATPCTAPFMAAAIGYALAQPAAITFAVFTAIALGLAAPYVALTLQPAWTRLLPRPGVWMEILRQAVSVPIFATVIWLAWVLAQAHGANVLAALLLAFLLLAIAGWFLGRWPAQRWSSIVAALLVIAVIGVTLFGRKLATEAAVAASPATSAASSSWQPWSAEAVQSALAAGRPAFVDFTAGWCLSCQVNERVALRRPEIEKAFANANVALFRADWTREDPAITQALTALGRSGVPAYALYVPGEANPRLLPEVLTPGIVLDALDKLPNSPTAAR